MTTTTTGAPGQRADDATPGTNSDDTANGDSDHRGQSDRTRDSNTDSTARRTASSTAGTPATGRRQAPARRPAARPTGAASAHRRVDPRRDRHPATRPGKTRALGRTLKGEPTMSRRCRPPRTAVSRLTAFEG